MKRTEKLEKHKHFFVAIPIGEAGVYVHQCECGETTVSGAIIIKKEN